MENASKRLPITPAFVLVVCLLGFLAVWPFGRPAHAASAYFADPLGNTEITVDPDEDFQIVLNVVDVTDLAGYEAKIICNGPITAVGSAAHGTWFATGHTVFGPYGAGTAPADYNTAMLLNPAAISGTGSLVVFSFHSGEDGIATIELDSDFWLLAHTSGTAMPVSPPTISVTVGTGEILGGEMFGGLEMGLLEAFTAGETGGGEYMVMGGPSACSLLQGDVNRDFRVNILDLIVIRNNLNLDPAQTVDAFRCDVNSDGRVNILDLIFVRNKLNLEIAHLMDLEVTKYTISTTGGLLFVPVQRLEPVIVECSLPAWIASDLKWEAWNTEDADVPFRKYISWTTSGGKAYLRLDAADLDEFPNSLGLTVQASYNGCSVQSEVLFDFLPLTATYDSNNSLQTLSPEPTAVLAVDPEPDGVTSLTLTVGDRPASAAIWTARCATAATCTIAGDPAVLTFDHTIDWDAPEVHEVIVTATAPDGRRRAITIVFDENNAFFTIPDAENRVVYGPAGQPRIFRIIPHASVGQSISVQAPGVTITPPGTGEDEYTFQTPDAGSYITTVNYTVDDQPRTYEFTYVAFEVRYVKAVPRIGTGTRSRNIWVTSDNEVLIYAETYPPVPRATWSWTADQATPEACDEFGMPENQNAFSLVWSRGVAKLWLSGYIDCFDVEVNATVRSQGMPGSVGIPHELRPHVLVPTVAIEMAGFNLWSQQGEGRLPGSGHNSVHSGNLWVGAPNTIGITAKVCKLRNDACVTLQWSLTDSSGEPVPTTEALLENDDEDPRKVNVWLGDKTQTLKISVAIRVQNLDLGTFSFTLNVWSFELPDITYYVGIGCEEDPERGSSWLDVNLGAAPPGGITISGTGAEVSGSTIKFGRLEDVYDPEDPNTSFTLCASREVQPGVNDEIFESYQVCETFEVAFFETRLLYGELLIYSNKVTKNKNGTPAPEIYATGGSRTIAVTAPDTPVTVTWSGDHLTFSSLSWETTVTVPEQEDVSSEEEFLPSSLPFEAKVAVDDARYQSSSACVSLTMGIQYWDLDYEERHHTNGNDDHFIWLKACGDEEEPVRFHLECGSGEDAYFTALGPGLFERTKDCPNDEGAWTHHYYVFFVMCCPGLDESPAEDTIMVNDDHDNGTTEYDLEVDPVLREDDLVYVPLPLLDFPEFWRKVTVTVSCDGNLAAWGAYDKSREFAWSEGQRGLWVEATGPGAGDVTVTISGGGATVCEFKRCFMAYQMDADVDSDNTGTLDRNEDEDKCEDIAGNPKYPGKIIPVADNDSDEDGIPDYLDGFDLDPENTDDDSSGENAAPFAELKVTIPSDMDLETCCLTISFEDASDPSAAGEDEPAPGYFRIWTQAASVDRDKRDANAIDQQDRGDYITPGNYKPEKLGFSETDTITLYVEGIRPSTKTAQQRILFQFTMDGEWILDDSDPENVTEWFEGGTRIAEDAVRFTIVSLEFVVPDSYDPLTGLPDADAKPVPTQFIGVSDPRPTVVLDPVDRGQIIIGESSATVIGLRGSVFDPIADNIPRGGGADIESVKVYVDGEYVGGGDPPVSAFDDNAPSFWRQHPYQGEFVIPEVQIGLEEGTHIIRVECSENAAGNTGFDEIAVTLEKRVIPGSVAGGGTTVAVSIAFDADPSIDTRDEIRYYYGEDDEDAATLKEALKDIWWAGAEPYGPWELYSLNGLAVLGDEVFVADGGNGRVRKFTSMGAFRAATPPGTFDQPYGLCVAGGYLYLAEATTPPDTGAIVKLDRDSLAEVARYTDDLLCQPLGVAVDAAGNIYTVHVNVPGILKRDAATGAWSTWKEGIAGFSVAVSGDGHIYVIEQGVNEYVIRKFSLADGSGGAWETSVPIVQPDGLAVDSANRVYVCDADSRKILRFAADGTLLGQFDSPALFNGAWQHPVAVSDGSVICTASDVAGQVVAIRNMLTFVSDENNRFDGADVEVNITKIDGQSVEGMTVFDVSTWTTIDATVAYWRSGVMQMSYSKQFSKVEGETGLFQAMWSVSGGVQEDDPQIQWIAGSVHSGGAKPRVAYIPATARATAVLDLSTFSLAIGSVDYDLEQDGMYAYPQGGSFAFVVVVPDKDVPSARAKSICYDKAGNIVHKEDIVFPDGLFGNIASKAQDIAFEAHRDAAIVRHNWVLITHDPRFEAVAQESAGKLKQAELMSNKATLSFPCTEQEAEYYTATLAGEGDDCPGHKVWSDNLITFEFRTDEDDGNGGRTGKAKTDPSGNVYIEGVIFHSLYTRFPYDIKVFKNDRPFFTVPITVAPLLRFTGSYAQGPGFYPDILKAGVTFDPCSDRFLREGSLTFTIPGLRMAYATVPGFEPFGDEQIPDTTSTYDRAVFTLQNDPDPNLPINEQGDMTGVHYLHCLHSPGGSYDIRSNLNVVEAKWEGFNDLLDAQRPVDGEEEGTIFLGSKEAEFESNWGQPPQTMQGYSPTFLVGEGSYLLKVGAKLFVDESQVHRYEIKIKVRYRKD